MKYVQRAIRNSEHNARPTLFLIRGAQGSGKSSLAGTIAPAAHFAADDYFMLLAGQQRKGKDKVVMKTYADVYDPAKLEVAHQWCREKVIENMLARIPRVAVANTFVEPWMMEPYFDAADQYGYRVSVVLMQNDFGNTHEVPEKKVKDTRRLLHECAFINTMRNNERLTITEQRKKG